MYGFYLKSGISESGIAGYVGRGHYPRFETKPLVVRSLEASRCMIYTICVYCMGIIYIYIYTYTYICSLSLSLYIYIYIYIYIYMRPPDTPNLPTNIVDCRGFDSSIILILRVGILMSTGFPGKFESSNVSRGNVSREIGRTLVLTATSGPLSLIWL